MNRNLQTLLLLTLAASAASYSRTTVSPLQETMRVALSLSDNQMSLLQGPALAVPMALAAIPLGALIDRYSRVRLLLIFAIFNALGSVLTSLAPSFGVLLVARCIVGFTALAINPVVISLIADLYAPAQRGRATMVAGAGQIAGMSAAFAIGGALIAANPGDGWRGAMLWLSAPLAFVALMMLTVKEPARTGVAIENPSIRGVLAELWRYRLVIAPLMAGTIAAEIAIGAIAVWTAPSFSRSFAMSADRVGTLMATALLISGVLGPVVGGTLADICQRSGGPRRTMSVLGGLALLAIPAGLYAMMPDVASAAVLYVVFKILVLALCVMGMVLLTVVVPNELRGLCVAILVGGTVLFSVGLAPLFVSLLSGALGGPAMIGKSLAYICVVSCAVSALIFLLGRNRFPARE